MVLGKMPGANFIQLGNQIWFPIVLKLLNCLWKLPDTGWVNSPSGFCRKSLCCNCIYLWPECLFANWLLRVGTTFFFFFFPLFKWNWMQICKTVWEGKSCPASWAENVKGSSPSVTWKTLALSKDYAKDDLVLSLGRTALCLRVC